MRRKKKSDKKGKSALEIAAEVRRERAARDQGYRERALKILPWVCGKCSREFSGKDLRDLTVHHKDHDHTNNPPDGSNWELLCVDCHHDEHARHEVADAYGAAKPQEPRAGSSSTYKPFADLDKLLDAE